RARRRVPGAAVVRVLARPEIIGSPNEVSRLCRRRPPLHQARRQARRGAAAGGLVRPIPEMIALLLASTLTFKVLGIDCAACAPPVKKALASIPGVTSVRV